MKFRQILILKIFTVLMSGSDIEIGIYRDLSLIDFIQRLLTKRCASFVGPRDAYMLLSGEWGKTENYANVGTPMEAEPLTMKNCLTYDEIKLSAFLSVSSFTELLNNGDRYNGGVIEQDITQIEREGLVIDLTGARFQRPGVMEYQDIIITAEQNIAKNGYGNEGGTQLSLWDSLVAIFATYFRGQRSLSAQRAYRKLWRDFYEDSDFLHANINKDDSRFILIPCGYGNQAYCDIVMMKKRFALSFDTLLMEAQSRAQLASKQAFVHIVGIGLGTWSIKFIAEQQTEIFLETFLQRVKELLPGLNNIGVLFFSWFGVSDCGDLKDNGMIESPIHPMGGIRTFVAKRQPAEKLQVKEFEKMLLIISYAGDGNALPGNEFWFQNLKGSSDSATACSTLVTELHNPFINCERVCGENLHIVSLAADKGVRHISKFAQEFSKDS